MGRPGSTEGFVRVKVQNGASKRLSEEGLRAVLEMEAITWLYMGLAHHCWGKADTPCSCDAEGEVLIAVEVLIQHWRGLDQHDVARGHTGE